MTEFVSLFKELQQWFDKPHNKLPKELRSRVEDAYRLIPWDVLSPERRRILAVQWDSEHDPALEDERQRGWDLGVMRLDIERQLRELELMAAITPIEIESKARQITELRQQFDRLKAADAINDTIARFGAAHKSGAAEAKSFLETNNPTAEPETPDVHFVEAREILKQRLGASSQEIAIWVWMGKSCGEIDGYRDAPQYDAPPKFHFPPFESFDARFDYVSEMMHCYFRRGDLEAFSPSDRYLTYPQLVERWRTRLTEQEIVALIKAEGATGELTGVHPLTGAVQGAGYPIGEKGIPTLDDGMFCLAHIEAVEQRVFRNAAVGAATSPETDGATIKGEKQCEMWLRSLMAAGSPSKSKQEYQLEAMRLFKVSQRGFGRAWGNAAAEAGNAAWSAPGRKSKQRIDTPK